MPSEDVKELVRQGISSDVAGKWLLIVDNADDVDLIVGVAQHPQDVVDYLPYSEHGLTVFTTRYQEIATKLAGSDVFELAEMNDQKAIGFHEKSLALNSVARQRIQDDYADVIKLLDELGYLPLAIAQAAAYLSRNKSLTVARYLHQLQKAEQDFISLLSQEFHDATRYKDSSRYRDKNIENAVAKTWLISFNQIREHDEVAAELLCFISCIESKAIPRSILPFVESEDRMLRAIGTLSGKSFMIERETGEMYDTHRLVHLAVGRGIQDNGSSAAVADGAMQHVSAVFPTSEFEKRVGYQTHVTHAIRRLESDKSRGLEARYALCLKIGLCLYEEGRIKESVYWLEQSCEWRDENLDKEHPSRLASQHALAGAYESDGQTKKAVELLEHVVAIKELLIRRDYPSRLVS